MMDRPDPQEPRPRRRMRRRAERAGAPGRPAPAVGTVEAACPAHEDDGGAARIA